MSPLGVLLALIAAAPSSAEVPGPPSAAPAWSHLDATCEPRVDHDTDEAAPRREYATPAEVDCEVPAHPSPAMGADGACDVAVHDASYRASRHPESELPAGSWAPAREAPVAFIAGPPRAGVPQPTGVSGMGSIQPLALFAVPDLPPLGFTRLDDDQARGPRPRHLGPLERPPRV